MAAGMLQGRQWLEANRLQPGGYVASHELPGSDLMLHRTGGEEMFLACKLWGLVPVSWHADGISHCNERNREKE